jgi:integrase
VGTKKGLRDRAMFATLLGCGLRRSELSFYTKAAFTGENGGVSAAISNAPYGWLNP